MNKHTAALGVLVGLVGLIGPATPALADAFDVYGDVYRSFRTPPIGNGSFGVAGDALPDGRLVMVTGNSIFIESAVGSAQFDEVGLLDASQTGGSTDPAFLTISPDGATIAVGTGFGKPVAVFDTALLGTPGAPALLTSGLADYFSVEHFNAAWEDNTHLALTAGDFGSPAFVSLLDTTSDPNAPINSVIVSNISGASAGIAFDDAGWLYTGNGFANGNGSDTGVIKAFDPTSWNAGVDFENQGVLIGDVLSAGSLTFDDQGNLFVGGGDFGSFDVGYLGIIHADAIADALAGFGAIDTNDPNDLKRLDPRGDGFGFFGAAYNDLTGELYVTDGDMWYATVPTPTTMSLLGLGSVSMCIRRRR